MTFILHNTANKSTPVSAVSFTGKERDEETGYGYFGARYYDSDLSGLFMSVDPMSDKYPSISPYAYCAWNPVKLVDTDGREIDLSALYITEFCGGNRQKAIDIISKQTDFNNHPSWYKK